MWPDKLALRRARSVSLFRHQLSTILSWTVEHKPCGKYLTAGSPIKFWETKLEVAHSPLLGDRTDEALRQLGYSAEDVLTPRAERATLSLT